MTIRLNRIVPGFSRWVERNPRGKVFIGSPFQCLRWLMKNVTTDNRTSNDARICMLSINSRLSTLEAPRFSFLNKHEPDKAETLTFLNHCHKIGLISYPREREKEPCPYRGHTESQRKEFEDQVPPRIKCRKCGTQLEISEPNRFYWSLYHPYKGFVEVKK